MIYPRRLSDFKVWLSDNDNTCISILTNFLKFYMLTKNPNFKKYYWKLDRPTAILQILWQEHIKKIYFHCMFPSFTYFTSVWSDHWVRHYPVLLCAKYNIIGIIGLYKPPVKMHSYIWYPFVLPNQSSGESTQFREILSSL